MDINQNLGNLMKEAQKMQERMQNVQQKLTQIKVTGEAGAGMVQVIMLCNHDVQQVIIKPDVLDEDPEIVGSLVAAAYNDANKKVEQMTKKEISGLTAGLNIPTDFLKDGDKE